MTTRISKVLDKLDEVELELRKIGYWDDSLDVEAVREQAAALSAETGRSPVGSMPFEIWLQAVFFPNARKAARDSSLPDSSEVGLMAMREYDLRARSYLSFRFSAMAKVTSTI